MLQWMYKYFNKYNCLFYFCKITVLLKVSSLRAAPGVVYDFGWHILKVSSS